MAYYAVHIPIQAKAELVEKYRRKASDAGLDKAVAFEEGDYFPVDHKRNERVIRRLVQSDPTYAAMIESLDTNIGRLLDALDEDGLRDNTVVFFTSDNGGLATAEGSPTCNSPLAEGKGWMYEGGTRVPLVVRWPGVTKPGSVCNVPVSSPDFYPTILDLARIPGRPQQHVDGVSLVPLLRGERLPDRAAIFWHYPHYGNQGGTPGCSVRMGDHKLIEFFEDGHLELYDLRRDVSEEHDISAAKPELTAEMHSLLVGWRREVEALIPRPNPDYQPRE
jgi:arylsulfatase A-like enzyme